MKVVNAHRFGKKTTLVTFIAKHDIVDPTRPAPDVSTTAQEFERRLRRAAQKPASYVAALPVISATLSYRELSAKYAAECAAGKALQKRMFGRA